MSEPLSPPTRVTAPPGPSDAAAETRLTLGSVSPALPPDCPPYAGRYRIVGEIGRGGMGAVWRAHDPDLDRPLAVKALLAGYEGAGELGRRFLEEARITGRLQH